MEKKRTRFHLVTHLSFIHSYFIDYLKDTIFLNLFLAKSVIEIDRVSIPDDRCGIKKSESKCLQTFPSYFAEIILKSPFFLFRFIEVSC